MKTLVPAEYVEWLEDWLRNRTYQVRYGEAFSPTKRFRTGIPQGSPISPFLFNIFLSGIPIGSNDFIYMDDILLTASSYSHMEKKLDEIGL